MAILTLAELKTLAGITGTDKDAQLTALLPLAQERLESMLNGRLLEDTAIVEDRDGGGNPTVVTDFVPVIEVTALFDDPQRDFVSGDEIDPNDYSVDPDTGRIKLDRRFTDGRFLSFNDDVTADACGGFWKGNKNVRISYRAGYEFDGGGAWTGPADLKLALALLTVAMASVLPRSGLRSETIGRYSYTVESVSGGNSAATGGGIASGAGAVVDSIVAKYRRPAVQ